MDVDVPKFTAASRGHPCDSTALVSRAAMAFSYPKFILCNIVKILKKYNAEPRPRCTGNVLLLLCRCFSPDISGHRCDRHDTLDILLQQGEHS